MKVLHVTNSIDPKMGGVSKAIEMIIAGLSQSNILNEVVSLDVLDANFVKLFSAPVHALGPGKSPWNYNSALVPWLQTNYSKFDIIIIHGLWLYSSHAVEKTLRSLKYDHIIDDKVQNLIPKVFVMPHGMLDPYFQQAIGRKLKAWRNWLYWKIIERHTVNNADGLLFTCEEEKQLASQPFKPYRPKKEIVVGLGIENPPSYIDDMRAAFLERCSSIGNCNYILFLSRIHEKKGVDLLINAYTEIYENYLSKSQQMEGLVNERPNSDFPKLVIAGPGLETVYGQHIQKLITKNSSLRQVIYFTGMLTGNAKWGAFYGSEAFILPSHQENFGIAVVEALACYKPVLISNKVNIWREIEALNAGIVSNDTFENIKGLLEQWIHLTPKEKNAMADNAGKCFQKHFTIKAASSLMLDALQN